jgi:hypothetical protein
MHFGFYMEAWVEVARKIMSVAVHDSRVAGSWKNESSRDDECSGSKKVMR